MVKHTRLLQIAAALIGSFCALTLATVADAAEPIVVQNLYYPKPGLEADVLRTRLEASAVRRKLGLQVGRVLSRTNPTTGEPYVIWECDYPSLEAREKDAAAAENAPEFKAVQARMSPLLARFERSVWLVH